MFKTTKLPRGVKSVQYYMYNWNKKYDITACFLQLPFGLLPALRAPSLAESLIHALNMLHSLTQSVP